MVLVGEWAFNEGSGTTAADTSGNNRTLSSVPGWSATGHTSAAMRSVSQTGPATPALGLPTSFTIMGWFYIEASSGWFSFFQGTNVGFYIEMDGTRALDSWNGVSGVGGGVLSLNTWYHIAYTQNATTGTFYVDGVSKGSGGAATSIPSAFNICGSPDQKAATVRADDVRIYNTELTAADITTAMNTPAGGGTSATANPATIARTVSFGAPTVVTPNASVSAATFTARASFTAPAVLDGSEHPFVTSVSANGRYFLDQFNNPILVQGDTVWGWPSNVGSYGNTWQSDTDYYINTRSSQGFNFMYIGLLPNTVNGGGTYNDRTWDGVEVFTLSTAGDYNTQHPSNGLNEAYWQRIDYLLSAAQAAGITVMMDVCYTDDVEGPGVMDTTHGNNTTAEFTAYGNALAARYKNRPNIMWTYGGDWYDGSQPNGLLNTMHTTMRNAGDNHLWGIQYMAQTSSRYTGAGNQSGIINGPVWADFNFVYVYEASYIMVKLAWNEPATYSISAIPVLHADGKYDDGVPLYMRHFLGWDLTSGSQGWNYGRNGQWPGDTGATKASLTNNAFTNTHFPNTTAWFKQLPGWHLLEPDISHTFLTAGYGTQDTVLGTGNSTGYATTNSTYVTAAKTPDGTLAVLFFPNANQVTATVDTTQMVAGYTATWIDPASGATVAGTPGTTFTRSTANSAGNNDWYLVLQEAPSVPASVTPTTINCTTAVGSSTLVAGQQASAPSSTITGVTAFGAPTITTGSGAAATPVTVAASTTITSPSITAASSSGSAPTTITSAASFGARVTRAGATVAAAAVTVGVAMAGATVVAGHSSAVSPTTVAASATVGTPSISAAGTANVSPGTINSTVSFPSDTLRSGARVIATTISASTSTTGPVVGVGYSVAPAGISRAVSMQQPAVTFLVGTTPATFTATSSMGSATTKSGAGIAAKTIPVSTKIHVGSGVNWAQDPQGDILAPSRAASPLANIVTNDATADIIDDTGSQGAFLTYASIINNEAVGNIIDTIGGANIISDTERSASIIPV